MDSDKLIEAKKPENLRRLYEEHRERYSRRLKLANEGHPNLRAGELAGLLGIWEHIKANDFAWDRLSLEAREEAGDAIFDELGEYPSLHTADEVQGLKAWTNGTEWYLARDLEHLRQLYRDHCGLELEHEDAQGDDGEWSEAEGPIGAWTGEEVGDGRHLTLEVEEWAKRSGPGYLCGREA